MSHDPPLTEHWAAFIPDPEDRKEFISLLAESESLRDRVVALRKKAWAIYRKRDDAYDANRAREAKRSKAGPYA